MRSAFPSFAAIVLVCPLLGCSQDRSKGELPRLRSDMDALKKKHEELEKDLAALKQDETSKKKLDALEKELASLKQLDRQRDPREKWALAAAEQYLQGDDFLPHFKVEFCHPAFIKSGDQVGKKYTPLSWSIASTALSAAGDEAIITGKLTAKGAATWRGFSWDQAPFKNPISFTIKIAKEKTGDRWLVAAATFRDAAE